MMRGLSLTAIAAVLLAMASPAVALDPNQELMGSVVAIPEATEGPETVGGYDPPAMIPASAFHNDGGAAAEHFFSFSGGYIYGRNGGTCMMAPVHLPNRAEITSMYITFIDNYASDMTVTMFRKAVNSSALDAEAVASVSTSGMSTVINSNSTFTITNPVVSFPDYHYYITLCLPDTPDMKFINARIYYTEG